MDIRLQEFAALARGGQGEGSRNLVLTFLSLLHVVEVFLRSISLPISTGLGKKVVPRLRELAPRGQRESGGEIHAT